MSTEGSEAAVLEASRLEKSFRLPRGPLGRRRGHVRAVDGLDLRIAPGEVLGIVGPPGSGKSTLGLILSGRLAPDVGTVTVGGANVHGASRRGRAALRDEIPMVLHGPDPVTGRRRSVRDVLVGAMSTGAARGAEARPPEDLLAQVGLDLSIAELPVARLTRQQRELVQVARAVALRPSVVVCDDPIESMPRDLWAQVVDVLLGTRDEAGTALVLISRDLADVAGTCDRVLIMYLGRVVEVLDRQDIPANVLHPLTHALVTESGLDPARPHAALKGSPPEPGQRPSGCVFEARCFRAQAKCLAESPRLVTPLGSTHPVACHFPEAVGGAAQATAASHPGTGSPDWPSSTEPTGRDFAQG